MMSRKDKMAKNDNKKGKMDKGVGGFVYFLTFIGAAIYFIGNASGFWAGVVAFLKAIVWPVFLIIKAFQLLHL